MAPLWVYRDSLRFSVAECQAAEAQPLMPAAPAAVLAIEAQHSAILAARSHGQTHVHHHTPANAYPGMPVHEPPPTNELGFAEDAAPGMSREGTSVDVKPAPRLTVLSVTKSLIAGGVAGGVSRTAVAPLERLKILLQVQNTAGSSGGTVRYRGMGQGLQTMWREEGMRGLFRGNGTNCARIVPNSAVKFFAYEEASQALLWAARHQSGNEDLELTPVLRLFAGATAGIIAMSATYPMDMVRGRLTVQSESGNTPWRYRGTLHALASVWREEGPRALYRGWVPSVIGVVPYVGLNFAVYETLKEYVALLYAKQQTLESSPPSSKSGAADLSVVAKLACGAVAGTIGQTVAYPLDVVRRRLQMVHPAATAAAAAAAASPGGAASVQLPGPQYSGMMDAFRQTVRQEGWSALFKGLVPNSVKVVPSIAIAFVTYEVIKDLLGVEIRISD